MNTIVFDGLVMKEAVNKYKRIRIELEELQNKFREIQQEYSQDTKGLELEETLEKLNREYECTIELLLQSEQKICAIIEVYEEVERRNMKVVERLGGKGIWDAKANGSGNEWKEAVTYFRMPETIRYSSMFYNHKIQHEQWLIDITATMF